MASAIVRGRRIMASAIVGRRCVAAGGAVVRRRGVTTVAAIVRRRPLLGEGHIYRSLADAVEG